MSAQIILSNTYHLFLRPGHEIVEKAGGLHKFMHWDKPILTDSGGFQVFSLSDLRKVSTEGVEFRSHLSGEKFMMTPELCMKIQRSLDSDIHMALDQCTEAGATYAEAEKGVQRRIKAEITFFFLLFKAIYTRICAQNAWIIVRNSPNAELPSGDCLSAKKRAKCMICSTF